MKWAWKLKCLVTHLTYVEHWSLHCKMVSVIQYTFQTMQPPTLQYSQSYSVYSVVFSHTQHFSLDMVSVIHSNYSLVCSLKFAVSHSTAVEHCSLHCSTWSVLFSLQWSLKCYSVHSVDTNSLFCTIQSALFSLQCSLQSQVCSDTSNSCRALQHPLYNMVSFIPTTV